MNFSAISNDTLIGRALRFPFRLIPKNLVVPVLQGPLRGKRWIAGSSTSGCWLGSYEYEKQKVFSGAIRPGHVVHDWGANVGFYSLLASVLAGPHGRVFSFEPAPRNLAFLRRHLELNKARNCTVFDAAVSSSAGTAYFDVGPDSMMGHLIGAQQTGQKTTLCVATLAVDDLVASSQILPPNVIKCDIEGGEYDALTGALQTLKKWSPTVFLATHSPEIHKRCCKLLCDLGYALTALDGLALHESREILATRRDDPS